MPGELLKAGKQSEEPSPNRADNVRATAGGFGETCDILSARVARFLKKRPWVFDLLLVAVTLIAYAPAWNGKPVWDDDKHIVRPEMRSWSGLASIWFEPRTTQQYHPLVDSLFWAGDRLWGNSTIDFHILNILLHVGSALLLLRILRKLEIPGAMLAAAVFALHPIEVESVAWMAELKNTLSGFFFFASLLAYLEFDRTRSRRDYAIVIALFVIGLFAKTIVAILPIPVLIVLWWKRGKLSWQRDVRPLVPFLILGALAGAITGWMEAKFSGAEGSKFDFSFIERCLIAGRAFWLYLANIVWPSNLCFIYPRWNIDTSAGWQYLFPLAVILFFAVVYGVARFLRVRGPLAAALFFGALIFPLIGFFNVYFFTFSFVADHFQYLPGVGIITLISAGIALALDRWTGAIRGVGMAACIVLVLMLGVLTWNQCGIFKDSQTLYRTTLERNPDCWMACTNLGNILLQQRKPDDAINYYRRSLNIHSDNPKAMDNLGVAYLQKGRIVEAIDCFQKAIAAKPKNAEAHNNLANAYLRKNRIRDAITEYQKAIEVNPGYAEAHENYAQVLFSAGKVNEAISHLRKAEERKPDSVDVHNSLSIALLQAGRVDEALAESQKAIALRPNDGETRNNLGICLLKKGRAAEAISYFQKAMETPPGNAKAANNLAWVLSTSPDASIRNGPKAAAIALQLDKLAGGRNPLVLATLAAAYAESGRYTEATTAAHQALQLSGTTPNNAFSTSLKAQISRYESNSPYRESGFTAR